MPRSRSKMCLAVIIFLALTSQLQAQPVFQKPVDHEISVTLNPKRGKAEIVDQITLHPQQDKSPVFYLLLHRDYRLSKTEIPHKGKWTINTTEIEIDGVPLNRLHIMKPSDQPWPPFLQLKLHYSGKFHDPLRAGSDGDPEEEGILLSGASYFYPVVETKSGKSLLTFSLTVNTPHDWKVVSQGKRTHEADLNGRRAVTWKADDPQEQIFLVADRFKEYSERYGFLTLYAFLRKDDPALAKQYLNAARTYLDFYQKIFGLYPYVKFAMIENSRETGFGMPSFTLLGSKIIRFPFILNTSYPHEILHNWWGNCVYPDPQSGNWAEGITAYLSDHLFPDLEGKGHQYRFLQLMKYMNYVNDENAFPLAEFVSREDMASQAIGYGKMMMLFHMLRMEVGDEIFLNTLREIYNFRRYNYAGLNDLQAYFEAFSGKDLGVFFRQWTLRKDAPELKLKNADYHEDDGFALTMQIVQKQAGPAYHLNIPIAIWTQSSQKARLKNLVMTRKSQKFWLVFSSPPTAVMLDPYYDLFRKMDRREVPASIGQTYGAKEIQRVLPDQESDPRLKKAYHDFAKSLESKEPIVTDKGIPITNGASIWIFGKDNKAANALKPILKNYDALVTDAGIEIEGKQFPWTDHSFVFTVPRPDAPGHSATWIVAGSKESVAGLMRKLPHYGKYGYLVFAGDEPENQLKGIWPAERVGLMKKFVAGTYPLPPRPPLVNFKPEK